MNSKEALEELKNNFGLGVIGKNLCNIIQEDLERLERECYLYKSCYGKATNYYLSLRKKNRVLIKINNKIDKTKEKYKKAIELLKKYVGFKLVIDPVDDVIGITIKYEYSDISKEECEILKGVFENV